MKQLFRILFSFILNVFESGEGPFVYKASHRKILIIMGVLFILLSILIISLAQGQDQGYLFPAIIFGGIGFVSLLIGFIGSDRAVAKIWSSR